MAILTVRGRLGGLLTRLLTPIGSLLGVVTSIRVGLVVVAIIVMGHRVAPLINGGTRVWVKHHGRPLMVGRGLGRTPLGPPGGLLGPFHPTTRALVGKTDGLGLSPGPPLGRRVRLGNVEGLWVHWVGGTLGRAPAGLG